MAPHEFSIEVGSTECGKHHQCIGQAFVDILTALTQFLNLVASVT